MIAALAAVVMLQSQPPQPPRPDSTRNRGRTVTIGVRSTSVDSIALTPELEASAYRDPSARAVIARARLARTTHDSALLSYRATSYQRISLGTRIRALGRERLAMRAETASEIEWQRGIGARVWIRGSRLAAPIATPDVSPHWEPTIGSASSIPYFPGR